MTINYHSDKKFILGWDKDALYCQFYLSDIILLWPHGPNYSLISLNSSTVDVRIEHGQFCTSIHIKPTNYQQYPHYHSCHATSTKCSIPYSLATRGNHPDNLHTYTSNLTRAFTSHGFQAPLIHKQLFRGLHHPDPSPPPSRPWPPVSHHHPIHQPANSFTSSCTNVTYPITTNANCRSMNLIYQLQYVECNAFYIGETRRSLSDRMNGHQFTTTVSNPDLPVAIHTQAHLPENADLLMSYTNYLIPPQITSAANLKLHTNLSSNPDTPPVSTSVNPQIPPSPQWH